MKRRYLLLLAGFAVNVIAAPPVPAPATKAGTTVVGEDEAALGLYLMPWKDEDQRPAARSPSRYTQALTPADIAEDRNRNAALENIESYERMRRQSLSY
ncbi:hypothetical protein [uncultured Nevskia sp.]|uniref:hypothetical protein n=1 Tax=uncultured Nevskia sp. TaxID=228950 RepID=UPI0025F0E554|nr:hypothetical protein [uncultured Nevskia sp.]